MALQLSVMKNYLINGCELCKFCAVIKLSASLHHLPFDFREVQPPGSYLSELELRTGIFIALWLGCASMYIWAGNFNLTQLVEPG